eukprot:CAMPEP_0174372232 /NCGR_PEP_ID=MMETSP0811_2-20130205/102843_1 /TAXON_ID=73025 ORGANISM="Eutreptiella gymnastica-like, Strain CCMP1594" /NCGR_SAMPLE_ID=MMETSP0811_2 /ASSEMBLY_ACC=CAM_ASM_000667 /LENGTH=79 /DNA_ID=CAMNT_0015519441 /DNA_START=210 /DNA_END=446 /DNA_ORIENTATION=+
MAASPQPRPGDSEQGKALEVAKFFRSPARGSKMGRVRIGRIGSAPWHPSHAGPTGVTVVPKRVKSGEGSPPPMWEMQHM